MNPDFALRTGNLQPILQMQATYNDGTPVNLTGCTVTFTMTLESSTTPTVSAGACTVTDASGGIFTYAWSGTQTATAGSYVGFATITVTSSGQTLGAPGFGFITVEISGPTL